MYSRIIGHGAYVPAKVWSNHDLAERMETTDAWIRERTGIGQRHIAAEGEYTSDLAVAAARQALERAGVSVAEVDGIVLATETPDVTMPSTAAIVQAKLGMQQGFAYDVHAACSGYVYAMATADSLLKNRLGKRLLVIGAETFSRVVDWEDRGTCILFGDGAGASLLEACDGKPETGASAVLASAMYADGQLKELLYTTGGVSSNQRAGVLLMQGKEVFRHAVGKMLEATEQVLQQAGCVWGDVDLLVPHQANARIIQSIGQKIHLPEHKLVMTVEQHANTSAASIPLALSVAEADGRLQKGMLVAMPALGAGLTWGACLVRW